MTVGVITTWNRTFKELTFFLTCAGVSVRNTDDVGSLELILVFAPCNAGKNVENIREGLGQPSRGATSRVILKYGSCGWNKKHSGIQLHSTSSSNCHVHHYNMLLHKWEKEWQWSRLIIYYPVSPSHFHKLYFMLADVQYYHRLLLVGYVPDQWHRE